MTVVRRARGFKKNGTPLVGYQVGEYNRRTANQCEERRRHGTLPPFLGLLIKVALSLERPVRRSTAPGRHSHFQTDD